jgi:hypothetical protein
MHLRQLQKLIKAFLDSKPYTLEVAPVPGGEEYNNWHIYASQVDPIPQEIGLVAGDFLTNLRASLDHLAWELVLANGGVPNEHTAFPIKDRHPRTPGSGQPAKLKIAGGVSAAALAKVEATQPYQTPDGGTPHEDRLWILERLVGIDKHRHLLLTITGYETVALTVRGIIEDPHPVPVQNIPLEQGTSLSTIAFGITAPEKVEMQADLSTAIFLRQSEPGGGQALTVVLRSLLERVRDEVVPTFSGLWTGG